MTKPKPDTDQCICTVLLISYNHEPYIRLAIESVLSQKTKYKFKVHIFDDASTDGTQQILRENYGQNSNVTITGATKKNLNSRLTP